MSCHHCFALLCCISFFYASAPTTIYTLSLHDALPISRVEHISAFDFDHLREIVEEGYRATVAGRDRPATVDRKSTRLNSSHLGISYAVFCLKKKKTNTRQLRRPREHTQRSQNTHDMTT